MSDQLVIEHCAPTLAGLKTANLFSCSYESEEKLEVELKRLNKIFANKGIRVVLLQTKSAKALIYLYRPQRLKRDIRHLKAREILRNQGYKNRNSDQCIEELTRRLQQDSEFPHEIGLFLGYPPEDVEGFMRHKDEGCKCIGHWKVYGDEVYAKKCFDCYKKCTLVYKAQFLQGKSIKQLTVAS